MIPPTAHVIGERVLLPLAVLLVSVLAGAFAARVDFIWLLVVVGVLIAGALAFSREATLWVTIVAGIAVAGLAQMYVPGAGYVKYIPPLAALALLAHTVSDWLQHPRRSVPSTVQIVLVFLSLSAFSIALNWQSLGLLLVGLKTYYPMWTLFLGLAMLQWRPQVLDALPRVALWLAVLQLPFVLHQFLMLVPMRQGIPGVVAVDIVAGTFGGDIWGGAANAVLTVFLITVSACLLGMWRHRALSGPVALAGVVVLLTPLLLNSARAAVIYVPLVFLVLFAGDVFRHPLRAVAGVSVGALMVFGMLLSYTALNQDPKTKSWQDLIRNTYEEQVETERERSDNHSSLSRWTALTFWAGEQHRAAPMETLFGHGPGASRVEEGGVQLARTLALERYGGRHIGFTAVSALLWDVGVIGLMSVLALFWAGFWQARRLARHFAGVDPVRAGIAEGLSGAMVIMALSLAHKDYFVAHVPYQTVVVCIFGYLAAQIRQLDDLEPSTGRGVAPPRAVSGTRIA